jgi:hypothetical protein
MADNNPNPTQPGPIKTALSSYFKTLIDNVSGPPPNNGEADLTNFSTPQQAVADNAKVNDLATIAIQHPALASIPPEHKNAFKQFLINLAQGGGEAGLKYAGLPTDYEKSQKQFENTLASRRVGVEERNASTNADYKNLLGSQYESIVPGPNLGPLLGINPDEPITKKTLGDMLKQLGINKGKIDVAKVNAESREKVAELNQGLSIPMPADLAQRIGRPELAGHPTSYKQIVGLMGLTGKNHQISAVGNRLKIIDRATGQEIADLGENPQIAARVAGAEAYAKSRAAYTPFSTLDQDPDSPTFGQPITISNLQAITNAAVPGGKVSTTQVLTGLAGLNNYKGALQAQAESADVLRDTTQRAAIAQTMKALSGTHELGVIDSVLNAKLQAGLLSPDAVKFIGATKLAQEFIGANRQFAGNFRGSQALFNMMTSNVASAAMSPEMVKQFINQDLAASDKIIQKFSFARPGSSSGAGAAPSGNPFRKKK